MDLLSPTLEELLETESLRWIFVGGKGGVGKTTTACSLAVQLSKRRRKVLLISTDPAHNIADAFAQSFSHEPTPVEGYANLFGMEIRSAQSRAAEAAAMAAEPAEEADALGLGKLLPELMAAFPGIDEALSFAELMNSVRSMDYDVIVFDTAPTGHTLRLIGFPSLIEKALDKLAQLRERMGHALQMMQSLSGGQVDEEALNEKLDSMRALTAAVKANFEDPLTTTFVCVCIPEFLSLYETERLVQALVKHRMDCSNIVVNQVIFPLKDAEAIEIDTSLLEAKAESELERKLQTALKNSVRQTDMIQEAFIARRRMQSKYLRQITDLYAYDFHVVAVGTQPQEIRGRELLEEFGRLLITERELPILEDASSA